MPRSASGSSRKRGSDRSDERDRRPSPSGRRSPSQRRRSPNDRRRRSPERCRSPSRRRRSPSNRRRRSPSLRRRSPSEKRSRSRRARSASEPKAKPKERQPSKSPSPLAHTRKMNFDESGKFGEPGPSEVDGPDKRDCYRAVCEFPRTAGGRQMKNVGPWKVSKSEAEDDIEGMQEAFKEGGMKAVMKWKVEQHKKHIGGPSGRS